MNSKSNQRPPKLAEWMLRRILAQNIRKEALCDLEDHYYAKQLKTGYVRASFWYYFQIIILSPRFAQLSLLWSLMMLKNYVKFALRNLKRQKIYSLINMAGLTIGFACFSLIFLYVDNELSYDDYHNDVNRIFKVGLYIESQTSVLATARVSAPLVPALRESFPEIELAARVLDPWWAPVVKRGNIIAEEPLMIFADRELFDIFSIEFLLGDRSTALDNKDDVVITEKMAEKYFGTENPIGKILQVDDGEKTVKGVVPNPRKNSHLQYNIILSNRVIEAAGWNLDNWGWTLFMPYIKLAENVDPDEFGKKIEHVANLYINDRILESGSEYKYILQRVMDVHLYSELTSEMEAGGNLTYVYIFFGIGILILLIAGVNYMNLATARYMNRAKEIGLRKVLGAFRSSLVRQFLTESMMLSLMAFVVSIALASLSLPLFQQLTGINFTFSDLLNTKKLLILTVVALLVGIGAGSYPALFLSRFQPAQILKTGIKARGRLLRKTLVVAQFTITIVIITGTLIVFRQIDHMKNMNLGFNSEQKLLIPAAFDKNHEMVKAEFLNHPSVTAASASWSVPGRLSDRYSTRLASLHEEQNQVMNYHFFDEDFFEQYGIDIIAGRVFEKEIESDEKQALIINEAAAIACGLTPQEAIGKEMYIGMNGEIYTIIGVTSDFHYTGVQNRVEPLVMCLTPSRFSVLTLTVDTKEVSETIDFIEEKWQELKLGNLFDYSFMDAEFNRQYNSEERAGNLYALFAGITIFISCLGLFGLTAFTVEQKTKEIGIRKVLGASTGNIFSNIAREFIVLTLPANIIAWPVAYYFMKSIWLSNFAYKVEIGYTVFLFTGAAVLILTLMTISTIVLKAASANPVNSIRNE